MKTQTSIAEKQAPKFRNAFDSIKIEEIMQKKRKKERKKRLG